MNPPISDIARTSRGWRLLAEVAQPPGSHDNEWMLAGLAAALAPILLSPPDRQRLENAMVEAVTQTRRDPTRPDPAPRILVRVLISAPVEGSHSPCGWSFFVIERAASEQDGTNTGGDRGGGRPRVHVIDLCVYADAGSA